MSNLSRTEPKLTADAAIARFINENPDDYATEGDSFDVDDVPENCELVGPVSYERDILAGIVLARTLRQYKDTLRGYEDRLERQAAWGKEKILQIRELELLNSQLEETHQKLIEENNRSYAEQVRLRNIYEEEIKARLDTQAKLNETTLAHNRSKGKAAIAIETLIDIVDVLKKE